MAVFRFRFVISRGILGTVAAACLVMMSATGWSFGLAGDEVQGSLMIPWASGQPENHMFGKWSFDTVQRPFVGWLETLDRVLAEPSGKASLRHGEVQP